MDVKISAPPGHMYHIQNLPETATVRDAMNRANISDPSHPTGYITIKDIGHVNSSHKIQDGDLIIVTSRVYGD